MDESLELESPLRVLRARVGDTGCWFARSMACSCASARSLTRDREGEVAAAAAASFDMVPRAGKGGENTGNRIEYIDCTACSRGRVHTEQPLSSPSCWRQASVGRQLNSRASPQPHNSRVARNRV